ncbi:hypothetical protein PVAP13_6NG265262 [Panicum virgatum]|uniref:Aminotransferase class V domain-containing protein n=1 Tax=Panicum virgatum TaxID=38727 RepID=A0A8T0R2D2_PANVG|nr:hypothetical protein PVAP13_6NG265262 [Panicum virgatum]
MQLSPCTSSRGKSNQSHASYKLRGRLYNWGCISGTGAWESTLTNTLSPGDRIVSFLIGQFSLLWIDQQQRLGFNVDVVESEWGRGADLDVLEAKLRQDTAHTIKAIAIVHNETATGVTNNLATVRKLLDAYRHPALVLVDGVSSICALDFRMDEWGVDVALTGSQKALSTPTGLGIVCASPKALGSSKTTSSTGTTTSAPPPGWPWRRGGSRTAPRRRSGSATRSPPPSCPPTSTAARLASTPGSGTTSASASASTRSPGRSSGLAISATSTSCNCWGA